MLVERVQLVYSSAIALEVEEVLLEACHPFGFDVEFYRCGVRPDLHFPGGALWSP